MNLKEMMYKKKIKNVDLVRITGADPSRISMHINGVRMLPKKYHSSIAKKLDLDEKSIAEMFNKERKNFLNENI